MPVDLMGRRRAVSIRVFGEPAPQGSKGFGGFTKSGRAIMHEMSKKVKPWRNAVSNDARIAMRRHVDPTPLAGPLSVSITFFMPKGKSVKRDLPSVKPDLSKLIRSTEDALTDAKVWNDDSQIVQFKNVSEQYADAENPVGAVIRVEEK